MYRVLFQIGPFTLYSYGFFIALAFLVSTVLILKAAERAGIPKGSVFDVLIAVVIGGLIGGRLLFVLINWEYYLAHPLRAFMFYEGGMAMQGAIVVALLAGAIMAKVKKLPFWKTADVIAPYIALGQAIGRIGCFLNGCCYGRVIGGGLGVTFPGEAVIRDPVQIYSSLTLLLIFVILSVLGQRRPFEGSLFILYLVLYSDFRFFMDFLRDDNLAMVYGWRLSQIISMTTFGFCVCAYVILKMRTRQRRIHEKARVQDKP